MWVTANQTLHYLSASDRRLIRRLAAIAMLSLLTVFALGRHAESTFLQTESEVASIRMTEFLRKNLPDLNRVLVEGRLTEEERILFRHAAQMGGVFRYKLFNGNGYIVHASRTEDVGRHVATPYFDSMVRHGRSYFDIAYRPIGTAAYTDELGTPYEEGIVLVGERYVPIMQDGVFKGAIEVYLDMTPLFRRLRRITLAVFGSVLLIFLMVGLVGGMFLYRNLIERRNRMEELQVERQKAERLARDAETMLKGLITAEQDKMNRVVNLMGGIAHEVGNPLTTLSAEVDGLEFSPAIPGSADAKRRIDNLRDALRHLETFLRDITAFSYQDDDQVANLDINETIRAVTGLVQLDDRARRATFALLLSPDVCPLRLPRQPVSLALFIIFSSAAQQLNGNSGEIQVHTQLASSGDCVEVQVITLRHAPPLNGSDPMVGVGVGESGHSALQAAMRLVASLGGDMRQWPQQANKTTCILSLPRRGEASGVRESPT